MNPITPLLLAALQSLPVYYGDRDEGTPNRDARLAEVAAAEADAVYRATCQFRWRGPECQPVWRGRPRELGLALVILGDIESHYARYVGDGRCHDGPRGARCDNGRSRTYWQAQERFCPAAWAHPQGSPAELTAAAWCAARALSVGHRFCGDWAGAFGRYAGGGCSWVGGQHRQKQLVRLMARSGD